MKGRPDKSEAAPYYFRYIDLVPEDDVLARLEAQLDETMAFLRGISEEKSLHRYAPDKWSVRQVLGHVNDAERVFLFRAFWFARGFTEPLPIDRPEPPGMSKIAERSVPLGDVRARPSVSPPPLIGERDPSMSDTSRGGASGRSANARPAEPSSEAPISSANVGVSGISSSTAPPDALIAIARPCSSAGAAFGIAVTASATRTSPTSMSGNS